MTDNRSLLTFANLTGLAHKSEFPFGARSESYTFNSGVRFIAKVYDSANSFGAQVWYDVARNKLFIGSVVTQLRNRPVQGTENGNCEPKKLGGG